jgi:hypothetical protein
MVSFNLPSPHRGRFPLATSPSVLTLLIAGVFGCLAMTEQIGGSDALYSTYNGATPLWLRWGFHRIFSLPICSSAFHWENGG